VFVLTYIHNHLIIHMYVNIYRNIKVFNNTIYFCRLKSIYPLKGNNLLVAWDSFKIKSLAYFESNISNDFDKKHLVYIRTNPDKPIYLKLICFVFRY